MPLRGSAPRKNYEASQQFEKAGDAWKNAAHIWGPKVGPAARRHRLREGRYRLHRRFEQARQASGELDDGSEDFDAAGAFQMEAIAWDRTAVSYAADGEMGPGSTVMGVGGERARRQYHAETGRTSPMSTRRSPG